MDWYLEPKPPAIAGLRNEVRRYLDRHGIQGADVDAALIVVSELVTNAIQHAGSPVWVSLEWSSRFPEFTVRDLGPGFELKLTPPDVFAESGRGLWAVSHLASQLRVAHRRHEGAEVSAVLPVERKIDRTRVTVSPSTQNALPSPQESDSDGMFGRESFLRALVVELSHIMEVEQGPDAAATAITTVGNTIGGRMEQAYRAANEIEEAMDATQIADLFVKLKAAIDGDFYVIEANEERIVLGNRRCPFGDVVKRSPALCRMTSSVFGGIAARNRGRGAVQLEERIAVGDPECRVVVWLRNVPGGSSPYTHSYERDDVQDDAQPLGPA